MRPPPPPPPAPPPIELVATGLQYPRGFAINENEVFVSSSYTKIVNVSFQPAVTAFEPVFNAIYGANMEIRPGSISLMAVLSRPIRQFLAVSDTPQGIVKQGHLTGPAQAFQYSFSSNLGNLPFYEASDIAPLGDCALLALKDTANRDGLYKPDCVSDTVNNEVYFQKRIISAIGSYKGDVVLGFGDGAFTQGNGEVLLCGGVTCSKTSPRIVPAKATDGAINSIASAGSNLFYTWRSAVGSPDGTVSVWRGSGASTDLVSGQLFRAGQSIATDGKSVYYASDDVVYAVPVGGGAPVRIAPVTGKYADGVGRIVTTASHVYWVTGPATTTGSVYRRKLE
jgi:hypothetical protein